VCSRDVLKSTCSSFATVALSGFLVDFLSSFYRRFCVDFCPRLEIFSRCLFSRSTLAAGITIVFAVLVATAVQPPSVSSLLVNIAMYWLFRLSLAVFGAFFYFLGSICFGVGLSPGFGRPCPVRWPASPYPSRVSGYRTYRLGGSPLLSLGGEKQVGVN